jgi:hypothetical protein
MGLINIGVCLSRPYHTVQINARCEPFFSSPVRHNTGFKGAIYVNSERITGRPSTWRHPGSSAEGASVRALFEPVCCSTYINISENAAYNPTGTQVNRRSVLFTYQKSSS